MHKKDKQLFIIIGIQKAGTSTIFDLFKFTDKVYAPAVYKDVHLFNDIQRNKSDIQTLLDTEKTKILHAAVNYITHFNSIRNINQSFPNARYIVIIRNPVKRAISAYKYFKSMGIERRSINAAFEQELDAPASLDEKFKSYLNHGLYAQQLKRNVFPQVNRHKIGLFIFDDIFSDDGIF